jgi:hypothetical protein
MTAGHAWDELYERVDHLPPAKMRRVLRLVIDALDEPESGSDEDHQSAAARPTLTWSELRASAESLPAVDPARFRADVDAIADRWADLGGTA